MSVGFVIGNGLSRSSINLTNLNGITYGCNALYRDFTPDYLFSLDIKMIEEIINSPLFEKNKLVLPKVIRKKWPDKKFYSLKCPPTIGVQLGGQDTGHLAFKHAIFTEKQKTIYLLGFDFIYLTKEKNLNNLYKNTKNYNTTRNQYKGKRLQVKLNVIKSILHYCKVQGHIKVIRVIDPEISFLLKEKQFHIPKNYSEITVEEFKKYHGS